MQLFYHSQLINTELQIGQIIELPDEEAAHAIKVMRYLIGDKLWITNGKGALIHGHVVFLSKRICQVCIDEINISERRKPYYIHAVVAPTKNINRFEWFLEKATEIGLDEITPLLSFHSERRNVNKDRLEKIAVSAMKQSLKSWLPIINEPVEFKKFAKSNQGSEIFLAHLEEADQLLLKNAAKGKKSMIVVVGPEGDFSTEEIALAKSANWQIVSLGSERLRTETAALAAVFTLNLINL